MKHIRVEIRKLLKPWMADSANRRAAEIALSTYVDDTTAQAKALEKKVEALRKAGLHEILFRNAGVGCLFYTGPYDGGWPPPNWRDHLVVQEYYPSFAEAINAEYNKRFSGQPSPDDVARS